MEAGVPRSPDPVEHWDTVYEGREPGVLPDDDAVGLAALAHYGPIEGARLLDLGCGTGEYSRFFARHGALVIAVDRSEVAVSTLRDRCEADGITTVEPVAAEAFELASLGQFDFVFGSGILHHLDYDKAMSELRRVLKPGGIVLFTEPLGHNPAIEFYRKRTPEARTPDEHPLLVPDFRKFDATFEKTDVRLYGLTSLGSVLFRKTPLLGPVRAIGAAVDSVLLRIPGLKWWAWYALMEGRRA